MMAWIKAGIVSGLVPLSASAQSGSRGVEFYAGWQELMTSLRVGVSHSASREGGSVIGMSIYGHANRPVLWRVNAEIVANRIHVRARDLESASEQTYAEGRHEYTGSFDGAVRFAGTRLAGRSIEHRLYGGTGVRRTTTGSRHLVACTSNTACYALHNYLPTTGAVWRAGLISTSRGWVNHARLDLAYQLSKPWHRYQHHARLSLRIG
jgi:hypothetical protein